MSTAEANKTIISRELREAVDRAPKGVRDPEAMRAAAERMDRMREGMAQTNVAAELIREARDEA